jgi:hypothetical protein
MMIEQGREETMQEDFDAIANWQQQQLHIAKPW